MAPGGGGRAGLYEKENRGSGLPRDSDPIRGVAGGYPPFLGLLPLLQLFLKATSTKGKEQGGGADPFPLGWGEGEWSGVPPPSCWGCFPRGPGHRR